MMCYRDKLTMWQQAYPDLDVKRELYQMASWCVCESIETEESKRCREIHKWLAEP